MQQPADHTMMKQLSERCNLLETTLRQMEKDYIHNLHVIAERDEELKEFEVKEQVWHQRLQAKENELRFLETKLLQPSPPRSVKTSPQKVIHEKSKDEINFLRVQLQRFLKYFKDIQSRLTQLEKKEDTVPTKTQETKRGPLPRAPSPVPERVQERSTQTTRPMPSSAAEEDLRRLQVSHAELQHENELLSNTIRDMRLAMEECVQESQQKMKAQAMELEQLRRQPDPSPAYKQLHQAWVEVNAHLLQVMQDRDLLIEKSNRIRAQLGRKPVQISMGTQTEGPAEVAGQRAKKGKKTDAQLSKVSLSKEGLQLRKQGIRNWNEIED